MKKCYIFILASIFFYLNISPVSAQTPNTITNNRYADVFIRSSGSGSLTVSWGGTLWDVWDSRYLFLDPFGKTVEERTITSSSGGNSTYNLNQNGDYHFSPILQFRNYTFDSNLSLVISTNKRKSTFRAGSAGQTFGKYFFSVPSVTTQFTIHGFASRGGDGNTLRIYRPNGSVFASFSVPNNQMNWPSRLVSNPEAGFWAVDFTVASSDTEFSFWVEGVPNYFSPNTTSWFEPRFVNSNVALTVGSAILGDRGLIGTGRVAETGTITSNLANAFTTIGLEANEVVLNHNYREPSNDNSDPNNLNLAGFNFSNQAVDLTINTLKAQPVALLNNAASWLVGSLGDAGLSDSSTHPEWAEAYEAVIRYYVGSKNYSMRYLGILDEPNLDPVSASAFASLFSTVSQRAINLTDTRFRIKPFLGSVTTLDKNGIAYLNTLIDSVNPSLYDFLAIHPWQMGYPGYGNIYSTQVVAQQINSLISRADGRSSLDSQKRVVISEVNAKFGDSVNQDSVYFASWDQSLWWASFLATVLGTGKNAATLYYPFAEDGTIHNYRAMVYADGSLKPVAYTTRFILNHILDQVLSNSINTREIDSLATISNDSSKINLILVNKEQRQVSITATLSLPSNSGLTYTITRTDSSSYQNPLSVSSGSGSGSVLSLSFNLNPKSVYSLDVSLQGTVGDTPTPTPTQVCRADVNKNTKVEVGDISGILFDWGKTCSGTETACRSDVNGNDKVEVGDIAGVLYYWGKTCQ